MGLFFVQLSTNSTVWAKSSGGGVIVGGGGDVVIGKDGSAMLADQYISKKQMGKRFNLSEPLLKELEFVNKILMTYGADKKLLSKITSNDSVDYRMTPEIPVLNECTYRFEYKDLSALGLRVTQAACTVGEITWFKDDVFKILSYREQALLIIHEGLRRIDHMSDDDIAAVTNGLRLALNKFSQQGRGDLTSLSVEEVEALNSMFETIYFQGLSYSTGQKVSVAYAKYHMKYFKITDFGGVVHNDIVISKDAKIGVGAQLHYGDKVGEDSALLGSLINVENKIDIGKHVKIVNSSFTEIVDYKNYLKGDSSKTMKDFIIKDNNEIVSSVLCPVEMDEKGRLVNVVLVYASEPSFKIGQNVVMENLSLNSEGRVEIQNGVELLNFSSAVVGSRVRGVMELLSSGAFIFKANTKIDLDNKSVCQFKKNSFKQSNGMGVVVDSKDSLIKQCRE